MVRLMWSMASTLMIKYVENMQEQSLLAQGVIKVHMLSNGYLPHNVHITRNLHVIKCLHVIKWLSAT